MLISLYWSYNMRQLNCSTNQSQKSASTLWLHSSLNSSHKNLLPFHSLVTLCLWIPGLWSIRSTWRSGSVSSFVKAVPRPWAASRRSSHTCRASDRRRPRARPEARWPSHSRVDKAQGVGKADQGCRRQTRRQWQQTKSLYFEKIVIIFIQTWPHFLGIFFFFFDKPSSFQLDSVEHFLYFVCCLNFFMLTFSHGKHSC